MAPVVTRTLVLTTLLAPLACYSPRETRGANEALAIYHRNVRASGASQPRGPAPEARLGAAPDGVDAPMTVDLAIALAKRNSARLGELTARVAVADAAIEAAGQRKNPDLRATNVRAGRAIDQGEDLSVTPRIRFYPERPGEIGARQAEARAASEEARAAARLEEIALEAEVRWIFDDVLLLDAEIAASARVAATRRKLATRTHDQLATATSTAVDASLAELHAIEVDGEVAELRSRRALLTLALLDRIGRGAGTKLELVGDPAAWPPPPLPSEQILIEEAIKDSPHVAGAAARIDGASARLHLEERRRWPWFNFVEVGYEIQSTRTTVPLWTVGAGIELPIFSANAGSIRQAEASKAAAKQLLEAEVERIVRDVRMRLRQANAAAALVTEFRAAAQPALERAGTEATRALESGAIDLIRVLTVEERRDRVQLELFRFLRKYRAAVDELRRAVGGPLPPPR